MVGVEDKHGRLLFGRLIRVSDFPAQSQYFVEFRIVPERPRNRINPICLRLKVLNVHFQIGKLLFDLDEPPFNGRRIGHGCLDKWSV